jgi:hypothetical protein
VTKAVAAYIGGLQVFGIVLGPAALTPPACQPSLELPTALPTSVWRGHLLPLLEVKEAVQLSGACRALRCLVRENLVDLGRVPRGSLERILLCFTGAQRVRVTAAPGGGGAESDCQSDEGAWVGDYGKRLTYLEPEDPQDLLTAQLWILPNVTNAVIVPVVHCHLLMESDVLPRLREIKVVEFDLGSSSRLGPLELLSQCERLQKLTIVPKKFFSVCADTPIIPQFIPASLKELHLKRRAASAVPSSRERNNAYDQEGTFESFLKALPSLLGASGAHLEVLKLSLVAPPPEQLAEAVRLCSSTLRTFSLEIAGPPIMVHHSGTILASLLSCPVLEELEIPLDFIRAVNSNNPLRLRCLKKLRLMPGSDRDPLASNIWGLIGNGLLPSLTELDVTILGSYRNKGIGQKTVSAPTWSQLTRAFETLAPTLRKLRINLPAARAYPSSEGVHALGLAVGKLARLSSLCIRDEAGTHLNLVLKGVSAGKCHLLWRLQVEGAWLQPEQLATIVTSGLPTIRAMKVLYEADESEETVLLFLCALLRNGYRHYLSCRPYWSGLLVNVESATMT